MSVRELITDEKKIEKLIDEFSDSELEKVYGIIRNMMFMIEFKKRDIKKIYNAKHKNKPKKIKCECCGKVMTNYYYYAHKSTQKYKQSMEILKNIHDKKTKEEKEDLIKEIGTFEKEK